MPHHPSEEETESNIFDKVAKGNPDSGASDHPIHAENEEPVKATAADHQSKGPAIPESESIRRSTGLESESSYSSQKCLKPSRRMTSRHVLPK